MGDPNQNFQLIWNQDTKIYEQPNFEGPTLKNKNSKILNFRGPGAGGGQTRAPNQNFSIDMKSGQQNNYTVKFWRSYVEKQKF